MQVEPTLDWRGCGSSEHKRYERACGVKNASVVKLGALVQTARHVAHRWKAIAARG